MVPVHAHHFARMDVVLMVHALVLYYVLMSAIRMAPASRIQIVSMGGTRMVPVHALMFVFLDVMMMGHAKNPKNAPVQMKNTVRKTVRENASHVLMHGIRMAHVKNVRMAGIKMVPACVLAIALLDVSEMASVNNWVLVSD